MSNKYFNPSNSSLGNAKISNMERYHTLYSESVKNPEKFWSEVAGRISWDRKWDHVREFDFF